MAVIFPIVSTFDAAGVTKAQRAFKGLGGVAKVGAVAFAALGVAATKYSIEAVKAAGADQKAQEKLAKTLQNVTGATDAAIIATEKFVTEQQFATGVSDNQLRPALENLVRATGDVTKAQELLKLGLDVSAGSGRDLESISLALAKAQGGQFTALQRLGIIIPENIKKSKDFGKVQEYLNSLFGGQAAVAADTFEGKMAILGQRFGEVQETIGGAFLPVLIKSMDYIIKNVMPVLEGFINGLAGQNSVGSAFSKSQQAAFDWGQNVRAIVQTVASYSKQLLIFGAALIGIWAVAKVVAAAGAIIKVVEAVIKVYKLLQTTAILAATAMAFASGGTSVIVGAAGAAAAAGAIALAFVGVNKVIDTYSQKVEDLPKISVAPDGVLNSDKFKDITLGAIPGAADNAVTKSTDKTKKATTAVKGLSDAAKAAQAQMAKFSDELQRNNEILNDAKQAYASFKDGVKNVITGIIDFGAAATAETGTFLENLVVQAAKAADFGGKVKQLLAMGLSETALQQVLAAGADAGIKIADEIIAGGATVVDQVNTLVTATQSVADSVGESAATQFYQAGITAGQALVDGVKSAIAASGFAINVSGGIFNQAAIDQVNAAITKAKKPNRKGVSKITAGERQAIMDLAASLGVEVPAFAKGGIVTGPTLALIGEAGPEAVVPLSGRNAGMGNTINLTVNAGMGADGNAIGREIVDIIKRYERVSGPVFASA
jgi:hypothetical protein